MKELQEEQNSQEAGNVYPKQKVPVLTSIVGIP